MFNTYNFNPHRSHCHIIAAALVAGVSLSALAQAQNRSEITINDTGVQAENLTSSRDGSVFFGSPAKGTIYRAAPGAARCGSFRKGSRPQRA